MLEALRALFGLFRSHPAESQEHARLPNGPAQWPVRDAFPYPEQFGPGIFSLRIQQ
jgi:hypothetical protein